MDFWEIVFRWLSKFSLFYWISKAATFKGSYRFVDYWVLGHLIFSVLFSISVYHIIPNSPVTTTLIYILTSYSALRVFAILVYQFNVLLFNPYRHHKSGKDTAIWSARRSLVLLLHNFAETLFWYSTIIIAVIKIGEGVKLSEPWSKYVISSALCLFTFDRDPVLQLANHSLLSTLSFLEVITGIFLVIFSVGSFIGMLQQRE